MKTSIKNLNKNEINLITGRAYISLDPEWDPPEESSNGGSIDLSDFFTCSFKEGLVNFVIGTAVAIGALSLCCYFCGGGQRLPSRRYDSRTCQIKLH